MKYYITRLTSPTISYVGLDTYAGGLRWVQCQAGWLLYSVISFLFLGRTVSPLVNPIDLDCDIIDPFRRGLSYPLPRNRHLISDLLVFGMCFPLYPEHVGRGTHARKVSFPLLFFFPLSPDENAQTPFRSGPRPSKPSCLTVRVSGQGLLIFCFVQYTGISRPANQSQEIPQFPPHPSNSSHLLLLAKRHAQTLIVVRHRAYTRNYLALTYIFLLPVQVVVATVKPPSRGLDEFLFANMMCDSCRAGITKRIGYDRKTRIADMVFNGRCQRELGTFRSAQCVIFLFFSFRPARRMLDTNHTT